MKTSPYIWLVWISLACAIFWSEGVRCQCFQNLNTDFPMGAADAIFQDSDGYLWIGTVNGLVRFDGYETLFFTHDPGDSTSIAGNSINAIGQDIRGRIWVGLSAFGLDVLDLEQRTFSHICLPDSAGICLRDISIHDFAPDSDHTMWVGSETGLLQFSMDERPQLIHVFHDESNNHYSLSGSMVLRTFIDSKKRLWIGTTRGINLFDGDGTRFINYRTNPSYPAGQILDISEDRTGKLWLSPRLTENCLLIFDEASENFIAVPAYSDRKLGEFRITFGHDNDLWISARSTGAYHVDAITQQRTHFNPQYAALHGFRNLYSLNILCDRYGNIWMTGSQVMKWPAVGKAISRFGTEDGPVFSVYADEEVIWFSDLEPKRLHRHTGETFTYLPEHLPTNIRSPLVGSPQSRIVYSVQELDRDHVIIASTRSIFIWNTRTDIYKEFPFNYGGPFRDFSFTQDRHAIWICGNQGTPILFNLKTGAHSRPEIASRILNPRCVVESDNGDVWFGSGTNGVYKLEARTYEVENFVPDHRDTSRRLSDYFINDITSYRQTIWIATNLGVNKIDAETNRLTYLRKQKNFNNENVLSILVDNQGDVWMGTQQGLVRYQPDNKIFTHFDRSDGLINAVYTQGVCFKDKQGILYFGGDRGVDFFDPALMGINTIAPDLHISKVLVNNTPVDTIPYHLHHLKLSHEENFIEIELLALHLTAPEANQYSYRIPELDERWRELGTQRRITLANMRPGAYTLQARAANADGIWSDEKTLLEIAILPPFWATSWFIALCILVTGILLALVYRYRIHQIQTQERLKSEFSKRIAELESKALRAQMNPHFLFNSINSVKSLISQGESEKATQYLTSFGQLIRQVLSNSEKPFVRLQEELEALRLYLGIEQLRFQNFEYMIEVADDVNIDFIEVPPLILQPYVENAIWHGLMHKTSGDRKVHIGVTRDRDFLHMSIDDNGIGREKAKQLKMLGGTRKVGMGMRLTGDRLNLLHKIHGQKVSIRIQDLHENGQAIGTRVEIIIPCAE